MRWKMCASALTSCHARNWKRCAPSSKHCEPGSPLSKESRTTSKSTLSRTIKEERRGNVPLFVHPEWESEFPWLVQGITPRAAGDFASFGTQSAETLHKQWSKLRQATRMNTTVLGRQVHGARVLLHDRLSAGLLLADESDGHIKTS